MGESGAIIVKLGKRVGDHTTACVGTQWCEGCIAHHPRRYVTFHQQEEWRRLYSKQETSPEIYLVLNYSGNNLVEMSAEVPSPVPGQDPNILSVP